jgi:site-specific DNA-methyltransferase (adenine-specific)
MSNDYNPDVLSCIANLSNDEVFTPPKLVNQILDLLPADIWSDRHARFLDPGCKSGVFLREIARRLDDGLEQQIPDLQSRINHICKNQLFGLAITELTSLLSRRSVYCSKTANGKYSVCTVFHETQGNIQFKQVEHTWKDGHCILCGANQDNYGRSLEFETHAYQFIHADNPEEIFKMKFDVIIGNPPYQLSDGGFGTSATPIYQLFVEQAKKLDPRFMIMIVPARWYSGGKGLDSFREEMLNDTRIREIHDFPDATNIFPGVQVKGGVCYFLWKRDDPGLCKVVSYSKDGIVSAVERPLLEPGASTFIRYNEGIPIVKRVSSKHEPSIMPQISSRKPFGLPTNYHGKKKPFAGSITLYENGGVGYVAESTLERNLEIVDKYKVLIPAAGSGSDSFPHPILGQPFVAGPHSACTETYMVAGVCDDKLHAMNLVTYITTKFFRFLVLLNRTTQHTPSKVYSLVPMQDFSKPWTDEKLYKKYGLTKDEIAFIESMVRPMVARDE